MRVLLLQLDGKLPNIALMRISAHYKDQGMPSVSPAFPATITKVTRWDTDRIEAEAGIVDSPSTALSERYREELATTCLILNREKKQAFMVQREKDQTCRQLDNYLDSDGVRPRASQLCALQPANRRTTTYGCPNPPLPSDKHGRLAPTPQVSNGVAYCGNWALNKDDEWEDHVHKCVK